MTSFLAICDASFRYAPAVVTATAQGAHRCVAAFGDFQGLNNNHDGDHFINVDMKDK
jgi:hypothetical protein